MFKQILFSLIFLSVVCKANVARWGLEQEDGIPKLNADNFDSFISDHQHVFVKFYAPWCGHCKKMIPAYRKLAEHLAEEEDGIPVVKLDGSKAKAIGRKYRVNSFPTLLLFKDGEVLEYTGKRKHEHMYNWVHKKTGNPSDFVEGEEDLDALNKSPLAVLYILPDRDDRALREYFGAADEFDNITFTHTSSEEYKTALEVEDNYNLIVFRNFDDGIKKLTSNEPLTLDQMADFVDRVKDPLVVMFNEQVAQKIFGDRHDAIVLFVNKLDDPIIKDFRDIAFQQDSKMLFSICQRGKGMGYKISDMLNVTYKEYNPIRIIQMERHGWRKYVVEDNTKEGILQALEDLKEGKLLPNYKSEELPEKNDGPVKTVVGKNFKEIVLDSEKFVLLNTHAPWCGHCKKLNPIYEELATKLLKHDDIQFATMDATKNEYPGLHVKGYPTLFFYRPGHVKPLLYDNERTYDAMLEFLEDYMGRKLLEGGDRQSEL